MLWLKLNETKVNYTFQVMLTPLSSREKKIMVGVIGAQSCDCPSTGVQY